MRNFQEESIAMMKALRKAKYVAMDTEFPGIVFKPENQTSISQYEVVQSNCNNFNISKIGFTLADEKGQLISEDSIWQFNLSESNETNKSPHLDNILSIDLHAEQKICLYEFAQFVVASGLVYNPEIQWIVFHGSFDFGYFIKLVSGDTLPMQVEQFLKQQSILFPNIIDIKNMVKQINFTHIQKQDIIKRTENINQADTESLFVLDMFNYLNSQIFTYNSNLKNQYPIYGLIVSHDTSDFSKAHQFFNKEFALEQQGFTINGQNQNFTTNENEVNWFLPQPNNFNQNNDTPFYGEQNQQQRFQNQMNQQQSQFFQYTNQSQINKGGYH